MGRRTYLFIPGIRQRRDHRKPGDWADRAASWMRAQGHEAECYEYFSTAIFRRWMGAQNKRVDACREILKGRTGVTLVGHSNGGDIICRLLKKCPQMVFESVHLIAPAVTADFRRNGLNEALISGQVDQLFVYGSENDRALWLGGASEKVFGWMGLGYGDLGRAGPKHVAPAAACRLKPDWRNAFDHSTWFVGDHFARTMKDCLR